MAKAIFSQVILFTNKTINQELENMDENSKQYTLQISEKITIESENKKNISQIDLSSSNTYKMVKQETNYVREKVI